MAASLCIWLYSELKAIHTKNYDYKDNINDSCISILTSGQ